MKWFLMWYVLVTPQLGGVDPCFNQGACRTETVRIPMPSKEVCIQVRDFNDGKAKCIAEVEP